MCAIPDNKPATNFNPNKTCSTCHHARKRETEEPCAACIHDEYVGNLPPFGKWEAKKP